MEIDPDGATATQGADLAAVDGLDAVLARLAPVLEEFTGFPGRDDAVTRRAAWRGALDRPLPAEGAGLDTVIDELALAVRFGCRIGSPGFNGFITTAGSTAPTAAALGASVAGGQRYLLHAFNTLEHVGLRWLAEVCGVPADWQGVFSSGGSSANVIALAAARQSAYERLGHDPAATGLAGAPPGRIYASAEAHRTIHRAAAVLGLGRDAVVEIPVDSRQGVNVAAMDAALAEDRRAGVVPVAVVAIAGTTNTGAIDAIADIVELGRRYDAWVHVDGAYGLLAAASPALAHHFAAVGNADSAIVDPHKWMATGVGVGATYVRDAAVLHRALTEGEAPYLEGSFSLDLTRATSQFDSMGAPWADLGLELSAPSRGALVWAVLREIGVRGLAERVDRHCAYARHVTVRAREHPRLEALIEPELSIACFRYRPPYGADIDALNRRIVERLRRETPYVPTSTLVDSRFAIRPCYINPRTTLAEVDGLVDAVVRLGDEEMSP